MGVYRATAPLCGNNWKLKPHACVLDGMLSIGSKEQNLEHNRMGIGLSMRKQGSQLEWGMLTDCDRANTREDSKDPGT